MRVTGKIVRFDRVRGYGFVAPNAGGDDVFLHVNDLEIEKDQAKPNTNVSFEIEEGDRGKFATKVRFSDVAEPTSTTRAPADSDDLHSDDYFDVLTSEEFLHIVTEMLLHVVPPLSSQQILEVRKGFEQLARRQGFIDS